MSRQRSLITQQHRPIRRYPPAGLGLRQGQGERGDMTAQIINLAEVRAERERRRALSLFEFWFLF